MNKVDAKARCVTAVNVADVVTELILLLVAEDWERRYGRDELIVAKGFEPGDGAAS